jgi:hypothetical protein
MKSNAVTKIKHFPEPARDLGCDAVVDISGRKSTPSNGHLPLSSANFRDGGCW